MKKIILTFALLLLTFGLHAQSSITITGKVTSADLKEPVIFASVHIKDTKTRTFTDDNGEFTLTTFRTTPVLEVSTMGYQKKEFKVDPDYLTGILITLEPAPITLPTVNITGEKVETVFKDRRIHIHDYEFFGDAVLLILHDYQLNRSKLVLYSDNDSILSEHLCPEPPAALTRDCFGRVHVLTKNYACQVWFHDDSLRLIPTDIEEFNETVKPCIGNIDDICYFEHYQNNQIKEFYFFKEGIDKPKSLTTIEDLEKLAQRREEGLITHKATTIHDYLRLSVTDDWKTMVNIYFMERTFFAKLFVPLKILGKEIYLFDHTNGYIKRYDGPGNLLSETSISYHKKPKWKKTLHTDEVRFEAFTTFERQGFITLSEIDLDTGDLLGEWEIPKQFVSKIMIRNGVAYFMYKETNYDETKRLYRMALK